MFFAPLALALCPTAVPLQEPAPKPAPAPPYATLAREDVPAPQSALVAAGWVLAITEELVGEGNVTGAFWQGKQLARKPRKPEDGPLRRREARIVVDRVDALYRPTKGGAAPDTVRVNLSLEVHAANAVEATETYEALMARIEDSPAFHAQTPGPTHELQTRRGIRCDISATLDLTKWTPKVSAAPAPDKPIAHSLLRRVGLHPEHAIGAVDVLVGEHALRSDILDRFVTIRPARPHEGLLARTPPAYAEALEAEGLIVTGFEMKPSGRRTGTDWTMELRLTRRTVK